MFACNSINRDDYFKIINKKLNSDKFKFIDFDVQPLSKKSGIFGEHYILSLRINRGGLNDELRFFLKTLPQNESQKNFTIEMGAFYKEEQMFKLFVPLLYENRVELMGDCSPRCYFTQPKEFLIFEDLGSKGYKCLNARESYDMDLVKLAVRSMASLHAAGIILEERMSEKQGRKWRLYDEYNTEFQEMLYCIKPPSLALIEACVKGTPTQIDHLKMDTPGFKDFTEKAIRDLVEYVKPSKKYRNTICHGDLWASNIMFKHDSGKPVDCIFVDYQSYRYCPPAHDLLTFIYLTTDRAFRQQHLQEVLDFYYQQFDTILREYGIDTTQIMTKKDFKSSCEDETLFAIVQSVTHFQIVMMSSEGMAETLADADFNKKTMFEDRSELIVMMCEKDPHYRAKQVESITDLRELFMEKCS